jgi:hypothetical protein
MVLRLEQQFNSVSQLVPESHYQSRKPEMFPAVLGQVDNRGTQHVPSLGTHAPTFAVYLDPLPP